MTQNLTWGTSSLTLLQSDPRIDLAIVNSGSLRQDIDMGPESRGDLVSNFPFSQHVSHGES